MSEKQKPTSDPFPHLPRRPLFTGYVATVETVAPVVDKTTTVKELREEVAKVENRGRGRPKSEGVKPWEAEGVSRASWYRRKTEGK